MNIQDLFQHALDFLVSQLQEDSQVIAVLLAGSLANDVVWEKSDIDLTIVVNEQDLPRKQLTLSQDGIPIHARVTTRNQLKSSLARSVGGSLSQSFLIGSRLLFSKDPTIEKLYQDATRLGSRDRDLMAMVYGTYLVEWLAKVEKWLTVRNDPAYASIYLTGAVQNLARVVMLLHDAVPVREAIEEAARYEPELFDRAYSAPARTAATSGSVGSACSAVSEYLTAHADVIFKAMLEYLSKECGLRTITEIEDYFLERGTGQLDLDMVCRWLAVHGFLVEAVEDASIAPKSRTRYTQPAYMVASSEKEIAL